MSYFSVAQYMLASDSMDRESVISTATSYGLNGPGIESRWGRVFPHPPTNPEDLPASCTTDTGSIFHRQSDNGMALNTRLYIVAKLKKE